jgi:predicted Fe-Mo cluster-binding NifX family protein
MRVAIPIRGERISPVFDSAGQVLVVDLDDGQERSRCVAPLPADPLVGRVTRLEELGVKVLICGGISRALRGLIEAGGICVRSWTAGPVEEVLEAYRQGRLHETQWLMPGCGDSGRAAIGDDGYRGTEKIRRGRQERARKGDPGTRR